MKQPVSGNCSLAPTQSPTHQFTDNDITSGEVIPEKSVLYCFFLRTHSIGWILINIVEFNYKLHRKKIMKSDLNFFRGFWSSIQEIIGNLLGKPSFNKRIFARTNAPDDAPDMPQVMPQTCPDDAADMPQLMPQLMPKTYLSVWYLISSKRMPACFKNIACDRSFHHCTWLYLAVPGFSWLHLALCSKAISG